MEGLHWSIKEIQITIKKKTHKPPTWTVFLSILLSDSYTPHIMHCEHYTNQNPLWARITHTAMK